MKTLKIEYKYNVGQIVYFMYDNKIRKGVVAQIEIDISTGRLKTHLTKKLVDKTEFILDTDYPFEKLRKRYSLDLVSSGGDFESSPHLRYEYDIYETMEEIIEELKS